MGKGTGVSSQLTKRNEPECDCKCGRRAVEMPVVRRCDARSHPAAGQLVEQLLVQRLVVVLGARRHENVAADEFVHHLAVGRQAREHHVLVLQLDHHALDLPVDVPSLHKTNAERIIICTFNVTVITETILHK